MVGKVFPSPLWWILLAISALLTLCGFYRFVWFMSVGYGFAVMGIGAGLLIYTLINGSATTTVILMSILLMVYGFRLGYFLLARELKNAQYRKTLESTGSTKKMPVFVNLIMGIFNVDVYVSELSSNISLCQWYKWRYLGLCWSNTYGNRNYWRNNC